MNAVEPAPWRFSARGIAVRLFLTCWLVYTLHLATNTVREVFLALSIGDHLSFRVDEYAGMHPDLFEKKGYGWHIGANPGASMLAAIPYAAARPIIDAIVDRVNRSRAASRAEPPDYQSTWPMAREFYKEAWRRGFDVKFGLAAMVMQKWCMAPISAIGVVAMFYLLRRLFGSDKTALWFSLLYAFGTPVFFRTGFLNHNMMLGHAALLGFLALWNPGGSERWSERTRLLLAGLAGGTTLLLDYGGVITLLGLFAFTVTGYAVPNALRRGALYVAGALPPVLLLWFYQWRSFGNPFLPGQHWMTPVPGIEVGYQGFGPPQPDLLLALAFDYRYGLFVACPLFLLALAAPFLRRNRLPHAPLGLLLGIPAAMWLFYSGVDYTRLQFNTGIRYLAPVFPFLFVPAAVVLARLPRWAVYFAAVVSLAISWPLAMHRDVERGLGILDPIVHVFIGGFKLPLLTVLSRMHGVLPEHVASGVSPLPLFVLTAALLYGIWCMFPGRRNSPETMGTKEPL